MPKVGPWEGCLTQVKTFFPRWAPNAWLNPTVVVLFPSPKGVGVIPIVKWSYRKLSRDYDIYLRRQHSFRHFDLSIFLIRKDVPLPWMDLGGLNVTTRCSNNKVHLPYKSISSSLSPIASPISFIDSGSIDCAISISEGTGFRILSSLRIVFQQVLILVYHTKWTLARRKLQFLPQFTQNPQKAVEITLLLDHGNANGFCTVLYLWPFTPTPQKVFVIQVSAV